jgi:excisionase family DNA binding protein
VANPILKGSATGGVWYTLYKNYRGVWTRDRLGPLRTGAAPEGITEREAKRRNGEIQAQHDLIRRGLAPAPILNEDKTLGDLIEWWLGSRVKSDAVEKQGPTLRKHIVNWIPEDPDHQAECAYCRDNEDDAVAVAIGRMAPVAVTPGKVDNFLHVKEAEGLAPGSLNHLRAWIRTAYNAAIRAERYHGKNPITRDGVTVRVVAEREHEFLREEWVPPILVEIAPQHRNLTAVAVYQGMRKGELFGLLKPDVDFELGFIHVRRSHNRNTTKSTKAKRIPIHPEAVPYLLDAIATSPLDRVFVHPDAKGGWTGYRKDHALAKNLRAAMRRAGVGVTHYSHTCRRCGHKEISSDGMQRFCGTCRTTRGRGLLLFPHTHVAAMKFHDTRHTTGTLLAQKGVAIKAIQDFLRHSDQRMTERYMHSATGWLREEISRLSFAPPAPPAQPEALAAVGGFIPTLSLAPSNPQNPASSSSQETEKLPMVGLVGATGFEPATPCPPGPRDASALHSTPSQGMELLGFSYTGSNAPFHSDPFNAPLVTGFVPPLSPASGPTQAHLRSVKAGLLTVRDVAHELGVCRATVYRLVEDGALPCVRLVKNIIRIAPADLAAYVATQKRGGR